MPSWWKKLGFMPCGRPASAGGPYIPGDLVRSMNPIQWLDDFFEATDVSFTLRVKPVPSGGIGGQAFQFSLQKTLNDSIPALQKQMGSGVIILDAANAAIQVTIAA